MLLMLKVYLILVLGNHAVCINAATMALIDAGVPMKDFVCACNAGYIEDTPLVGKYCLDIDIHLYATLLPRALQYINI